MVERERFKYIGRIFTNMSVLEGIYAEDYLYEFVNENKGLSIYEIAKKLNWSTGKVHAIVKKLESIGLIRTEITVENNRVKRRVYPVSWESLLPEDVK